MQGLLRNARMHRQSIIQNSLVEQFWRYVQAAVHSLATTFSDLQRGAKDSLSTNGLELTDC